MFSRRRLKVEIFIDKSGKFWNLADVNSYLRFNNGNVGDLSGQSTAGSEQVLIFDDFKIDVNIKKVFSSVGPTATIKIYGVSKKHLDMMTVVKTRTIHIANNRVRVSADNGNGYIMVFEGCITEAVPVYESAPECFIQIESSMAAFDNAKEVPPIPSGKRAAISDICKLVCSSYGVNCIVADDVDLKKEVTTPALNQKGLTARLAVLSEGFDLSFIYTTEGYRVFKKGSGSRIVWEFTPDKYIGYPSYSKQNLKIKTENFSNIAVYDLFRISGSEVTFANGLWYINMIQYNLQSRMPGGKWEAIIYGYPVSE